AVLCSVLWVVCAGIRSGGKPFLHIGDFPVGVVKPASEQFFGGCFASRSVEYGRRRIEQTEPAANPLAPFLIRKVGLGQHDPFGDGSLLDRFGMRVERRL